MARCAGRPFDSRSSKFSHSCPSGGPTNAGLDSRRLQRLDLNNPLLTFTGKNGTLKFGNRIVWVDLPDKWLLFTGTWTVVGGTGAYAGLSGSGQVDGAVTANGHDRVQFFGFLTSS